MYLKYLTAAQKVKMHGKFTGWEIMRGSHLLSDHQENVYFCTAKFQAYYQNRSVALYNR